MRKVGRRGCILGYRGRSGLEAQAVDYFIQFEGFRHTSTPCYISYGEISKAR